ncbi:MAG: hypothetical protein MPN21_02560 [Thermoanaerobaculia bacterium]|nr:hypothetical protein [Thermoanaerobaculia bacterium]
MSGSNPWESGGANAGDDAERRLAILADAEAVAAEVSAVFGSELRESGVIHVTAVWQRTDGMLVTLCTGSEAPRVPHDALVLGLARARADAILTTGEILRREPGLRHALPGPGLLPRGLADWRRSVQGRTSPPLVCVMTRTGELDFDHPVFDHAGRSVIYCDRSAAWALESRAGDAGVELLAVEAPSGSDAVHRLRREFGTATVLVEAGPSVARGLYQPEGARHDYVQERDLFPGPPSHVDELLLTVLHRTDLETRFRGPRFLARSDVDASLGKPVSTHRLRSRTGDWELVRYLRD